MAGVSFSVFTSWDVRGQFIASVHLKKANRSKQFCKIITAKCTINSFMYHICSPHQDTSGRQSHWHFARRNNVTLLVGTCLQFLLVK